MSSRSRSSRGKKNNETTAGKSESSKGKMRQELNDLHQEMELVSFSRGASGHLVRKVSKAESLVRTRKRKLLEKMDQKEMAIVQEEEEGTGRRRKLGARAALEVGVVERSQVFPSIQPEQESDASSSEDVDEDVGDDDEDDGDDYDDDDDNDSGPLASDEEDPDMMEKGSDGEEDANADDDDEPVGVTKFRRSHKKRTSRKAKEKRQMYRMKNFQSQKMAHRHGQALAAHARGQPWLAIEMLKKVAVNAPSAPQIYSSLGLVYEDLLKESRSRSPNELPRSDAPVQVNDLLPDPLLAEQLELAKKAYGSYHIAAILCKRDYTFWVRAADAGLEAAEIHRLAMLLPSNSLELVSYHRAERERWLDEVIRDLRFAHSLKPPGIDVPAKLAAVLMDLGSLLEALSLLTDLKNQPAEGGRGEFYSSYKAWLLYADLMLRIGHECIQWNRGDRSNQNYMFRRWLHKYSHTFDWQKRRLQALCMSLEAAAGTKNVEAFIVWMRQHPDAKPPPREGDSRWHGSSGNGDAPEQLDDTPTESLETERTMLLERHRFELESFDKTTVDMDVSTNSVAALDRQQERESLVQRHKMSVTALESEADPNNQKPSQSDSNQDDMMMHFRAPLIMSASCRQVCNIASMLMKHLHGLELYQGARLVGDSVSHYMKDRAAMYDKRSGSLRQLNQNHEMAMNAPLMFHSYDKIDDDSGSEMDDMVPFLSDDEDFDEVENSSLLDSLRRGILPPEMSVLYGMSLIVEGGKNFLALKCLEAIDSLEQESSDSMARGGMETDRSGKPLWHLFRRAMMEPLGRTAAYAFLADVLRKTGKQAEWSVYFARPFRKHLAELRQSGLTQELTGLRENLSPFSSFRRNQLLKVVLASCRFDVDTLSESSGKPLFSTMVESPLSNADKLPVALTTLETLTFILNLTWKVEPNGSLPSICLEAVKAVSKCLKWISQDGREISYSKLYDVLECGRKLASFFCGGQSIPEFQTEAEKENLLGKEWGSLPIQASWQDVSLRLLSLRVYNLTVACNVSLFSGWEADEFTLKLLRRRYGHKHFGVHLRDDRRVTGYLSEAFEAEIARQWDLVYKVLPNFPDVKFRSNLQSVKKSDWYAKEQEDRRTQLDGVDIARYAEDDAEATFLSISSICLALIASESNTARKNRLVQTVLSILLPISQFCLDKRLWQSDIGEAASSLSSFEEWRLSNGMGLDNLLGRVQDKPSKRHKKRRTPKFIERKLREWIEGTDKPTLQSFVSLPSEELTKVWLSGCEDPTVEQKKEAGAQMQKVHEATKQLRACYTEVASGRASLQVAVALLRLGSMPGCLHPFICLQQAAMFAGQSLSAGNNDSAFRDEIPDERRCTALEGLSIIGRADCLHSMHFADEAAFLCSYVAKVCRLHRDRGEPEMEWNQQWKVLAIYAYNVSVMIRTTVSTVLDKKSKKSFLVTWERDVVEELERGRTDGCVWKRALFNSSGATARPESDQPDDVVDEDEHDEHDTTNEFANDGSSVESETDEKATEELKQMQVETRNASPPPDLPGDGYLETSRHVYFELPPAIQTTGQSGNRDDTGSLDDLVVVEL